MEVWRISWRWASKQLDCTASGIARNCHAGCCFSRGGSYWPANAHSPVDGPCFWLGPKGCQLPLEDRPISCLMYPLVLTKANTWVTHFRSGIGCCRTNVGQGPRVIDVLREPLVALFGVKTAAAVRDDILGQRDAEVPVTNKLSGQWRFELELKANRTIPKPRRGWN